MPCVIVDYGLGNLRSVQHKLLNLGWRTEIAARPDDLAHATAIILPGVGHFAEGMRNLKERKWTEALHKRVLEEGIPLLGICLGMQLLAACSEEGDAGGLGWISGRVVRFESQPVPRKLVVPHVGWKKLHLRNPSHPLFKGVAAEQRFYFVHSYYMKCDDSADVLATARYGVEFAAVVQHGKVFGVQFHPEKSHREGMVILRNFLTMSGVERAA
jgi:glutamine amidotransferase